MAGLLDFLQSASNAAASNVSGPIDGLAWLLRKAGLPVPEDSVGSSAWMEKKGLTKPVQQGAASLLGETAGLLGPTVLAAKAPQVAKGLLQMGENAAVPATMNRQMGAITADSGPILRSMTRDEFLGSPKIVKKSQAKDLQPRQLNGLADAPELPFMGGRFTAKYGPDGAVVLDGGTPIASYNWGDTLVVSPKYRRQGIGEELVYQQRTFFPAPAKATTRNKMSQSLQENVWDRIETDLARLGAK